MKGIILAGGSGTRLYPLTQAVNKQLLPVYDKPMIYYPLATLMQMGISDILLISSFEALPQYQKLLSKGEGWGLNIQYQVQREPKGLAEAYVLAENFLAGSSSVLILGDNVYHGFDFSQSTSDRPPLAHIDVSLDYGCQVYAYPVKDPERYGVIQLDSDNPGAVISIEEKPEDPKSDLAITGLYVMDGTVVERAKKLKPSARGELEIVDVIQSYLDQSRVKVQVFHDGVAWLDMGTHDSLLEAGNYIKTLQQRQNTMIACLEEIALQQGFIELAELIDRKDSFPKNAYGQYLHKLMLDK
jgi:glucose-1-phosphate thymidylyltransferase